MSDEKKFEKECAVLNEIKSETAKVIVGQEMMIDRLLTALICGGHVLLEGVPGLANPFCLRSSTPTSNGFSLRRICFPQICWER